MDFCAFEISSPTFDLHGVQLRETIKSELGRNYCGYAQNLQDSVLVVVKDKCTPQEKEKIKELLYGILLRGNKILLDQQIEKDKDQEPDESKRDKIPSIYSSNDETVLEYIKSKENDWKARFVINENDAAAGLDTLKRLNHNFEIKRSRTSQETAWALQGAGKIFQLSSKIQKHVSEQLEKRDLQKEWSVLYSLKIELTRVMMELDRVIKDGTSEDEFNCPEMRSTHQCIIESPYRGLKKDREGFLDQLSSIHVRLEEDVDILIEDSKGGEEQKKGALGQLTGLRNDVDAIIKLIQARLDSIDKQK
ncbi:MAG: hypothetical protein WC350_05300 [Candidatus Micrarchaeia archaeon]|jgi:hypothetical protein